MRKAGFFSGALLPSTNRALEIGVRNRYLGLAVHHGAWEEQQRVDLNIHSHWDIPSEPSDALHGGRPAAAPTAYHSPMDALANSYRLALVRTHAVGRCQMGNFHFLAMHVQMK
jgi:hypothetical protein